MNELIDAGHDVVEMGLLSFLLTIASLLLACGACFLAIKGRRQSSLLLLAFMWFAIAGEIAASLYLDFGSLIAGLEHRDFEGAAQGLFATEFKGAFVLVRAYLFLLGGGFLFSSIVAATAGWRRGKSRALMALLCLAGFLLCCLAGKRMTELLLLMSFSNLQ